MIKTVLKQTQWRQMSKARGELFFIKNYLHEFTSPRQHVPPKRIPDEIASLSLQNVSVNNSILESQKRYLILRGQRKHCQGLSRSLEGSWGKLPVLDIGRTLETVTGLHTRFSILCYQEGIGHSITNSRHSPDKGPESEHDLILN